MSFSASLLIRRIRNLIALSSSSVTKTWTHFRFAWNPLGGLFFIRLRPIRSILTVEGRHGNFDSDDIFVYTDDCIGKRERLQDG